MDQDYIAAMSEERIAVNAFLTSSCAAAGAKAIDLLHDANLVIAGYAWRRGESPSEGTQRSLAVARLFRNARLIHQIECAAKMGLLAKPRSDERTKR